MEKKRAREDQETLIGELNQGKELAEQLKFCLYPLESSPDQSCDFLLQKIISSYDKALSMLNLGNLQGEIHDVLGGLLEPPSQPLLAAGSPTFEEQCDQHVYKKRKTMPRWSQQVRVCSGGGQSALDDGFSWRKYGQKEILGANFPRAYYRCTHRNVRGCLATKQVQKSDADPSIFEITYRGRHTCGVQTSHVAPAPPTLAPAGPKLNKDHNYQQPHIVDDNENQSHRSQEEIMLSKSFSFSFPSEANTFMEFENVEANIFQENLEERDLLGGGPNFFFGFGAQDFQRAESEGSEVISGPNSVANSPLGDFDFPLDQVVLDPDFQFDACEFFS